MTDIEKHELIETITAAIKVGVQEAIKEHPCYFSELHRHGLHEFADAIVDEGANRETHIIVLRIGKNVQTFVRRAMQSIVWTIIIGAGVILFSLFGQSVFRSLR